MLSGLQMGHTALSGMMPSASSPRGAGPQSVDYLAPKFDKAIADIEEICTSLRNEGSQYSQAECIELDEIALKVRRLAQKRQTRYQDAPQQQGNGMSTPFPNINAGGIYR